MYRLERQAECGPVGQHPCPDQLGVLRHPDAPEPSSGQPRDTRASRGGRTCTSHVARARRPDRLSRRAFIVHVGAAAALLKAGSPALAQSASPAVPGKERLIVRSPRPVNLETPLKELTSEVTPVELFYVRNNYDGPRDRFRPVRAEGRRERSTTL